MNPSDYRDNQRRFVSAAEQRLKEQFKAQVKTDAFMLLLHSIINDVLVLARPIQQAGGAVKPSDLEILREHVLKWTMERLQGINKDDLRLIAGTHLAQAIMNEIEANPWGGAAPDALAPS